MRTDKDVQYGQIIKDLRDILHLAKDLRVNLGELDEARKEILGDYLEILVEDKKGRKEVMDLNKTELILGMYEISEVCLLNNDVLIQAFKDKAIIAGLDPYPNNSDLLNFLNHKLDILNVDWKDYHYSNQLKIYRERPDNWLWYLASCRNTKADELGTV